MNLKNVILHCTEYSKTDTDSSRLYNYLYSEWRCHCTSIVFQYLLLFVVVGGGGFFCFVFSQTFSSL